MQCLKTYDMETVKQYMERKNLDDANLAEILKHIIAEAGLSVGDLFDDDEICDHIHEAGIPVDTLYDEDDILECGCVTDKIEELEQRLGELEDEKDYVERDHRDDLKRCDELMRQLAVQFQMGDYGDAPRKKTVVRSNPAVADLLPERGEKNPQPTRKIWREIPPLQYEGRREPLLLSRHEENDADWDFNSALDILIYW